MTSMKSRLGRILIAGTAALLSLCLAATAKAAVPVVTCTAGPGVGQSTMKIKIDDVAATNDTITLTGNTVLIAPTPPVMTTCPDPLGGLIIEGDEQNNTVTYNDATGMPSSSRSICSTARTRLPPAGPAPSLMDVSGGNGIDDLNGGFGDDRLAGGPGDDKLRGFAGNDVLLPGTGFETVILGGADTAGDTISYEDFVGPAPGSNLDVNLVTKKTNGAAATVGQSFDEIEHATGGAGNDTLTGDNTPNRLRGLDGSDTLVGNAGDDLLMPGKGTAQTVTGGADTPGNGDTVSFEDLTLPGDNVTVTLTTPGAGPISGPVATGSVTGIENITGGAGVDTLTGDNLPNKISGLDNNDTLIGADGDDNLTGGDGDDILRPGLGAGSNVGGLNTPVGDTVSYQDITAVGAGVTLTLVAGGGTAMGQSTGTVSSMENITGSSNVDHLTGDVANNTIIGRDGDDVLTGGAATTRSTGSPATTR